MKDRETDLALRALRLFVFLLFAAAGARTAVISEGGRGEGNQGDSRRNNG